MRNLVDARRRWFGLLFLILAGGMLIWGLTILSGHLHGAGYLLYWSACFVLTLMALATAWLDYRAVRRQAKEQRRRLVHETIKAVSNDAKEAREPDRTDAG